MFSNDLWGKSSRAEHSSSSESLDEISVKPEKKYLVETTPSPSEIRAQGSLRSFGLSFLLSPTVSRFYRRMRRETFEE